MKMLDIDYVADGANLRGYLAFNEATGPQPGVLVFHERLGLGDFAMEKARQLASLGYVALAADMFGERHQAKNLQEVATLVGWLRAEPQRWRARGLAAFTTLAGLPQVDGVRSPLLVGHASFVRRSNYSVPSAVDSGSLEENASIKRRPDKCFQLVFDAI